MAGSDEINIFLLGKTGIGKSSLGNTILGDSLFKEKSSPTSETDMGQAERKYINGVPIKVIDTPGFVGNTMDEERLKREIIHSVKLCEGKIDAILIVLRVDRYTDQEKEIIKQIEQCFSEEALKRAVVVFTHGDQLEDGMTIEDFVEKDSDLKKFVERCGGRCHVLDSKYWKEKQEGYRSNKFQVEQLLNTIKTIKNSQGSYTNQLLELVGEEGGNGGKGPNSIILAGVTVGALLGAIFGAYMVVPCAVALAAKAAVGGAVIGGAVGGAVATVGYIIKIGGISLYITENKKKC
ncbi:GTPase IMAP family member 8-like isoform X1 [Cyprinodon tularosa]|uniref:GTPase IMAP family member 8-like isoform X1 n=1 Tax=Cyprinodon tularosa TaxID=77115 RepID=UPI0018E1DF21|nr:GTPase IMAP family member 8-like isoform X1 [Cyprinodon tularosa]